MSNMQDKVFDVFGRDRLKAFPEGSVTDLPLSDTTKHFLCEIGLPIVSLLELPLQLNEEQVPTLQQVVARAGGEIDNGANQFCIGIASDQFLALCVEAPTDIVSLWYEVAPLQYTTCFVNSSLEAFCFCLAIYQDYGINGWSGSEQHREEYAISAAEEMKRADPLAFSSDENWWPQIAEQMEYGLL